MTQIPEKVKPTLEITELVVDLRYCLNSIIDHLHTMEAEMTIIASGKAVCDPSFAETTKPKRWRAEVNDDYWFMVDTGEIGRESEDRHSIDTFRYNTGNYFKTEGEAIAYREKLLKDNEQ